MLKTIDAARIAKVIRRLRERAQESYSDHISFFSLLEIFGTVERIQSDTSAVGGLIRYYARRNKIELSVAGVQSAIIAAEQIIQTYQDLISMALDLQVRKNISSLSPGVLILDAFYIEAWIVESCLIVLPEDLDLLAAQKNSVVNFFLRAAQSRRGRLYANGVEFADYASVPTVASMYEWAYTLQSTPGRYALLLINGSEPTAEGSSYLFESIPL